MKIIIIIPTYNESENTQRMIPTLADIVPGIKDHVVEVLYVDDSSPDGTAQIVKGCQDVYPWLHLLDNGKKEGLGAAYTRGMIFAMQELHADYFMEFDADFQHSPDDIPRLIAEINRGYDYIIGSRYIPGGSIPPEWEFQHKAISWVGNLVARLLLLLPQIHDCTSGFKLSRIKGFMDEFDFSTLLSRRFAYKTHLLAYMAHKGAKIKEVPIEFQCRTSGDSKLMTNEIRETLRVIFAFQLSRIKQIFKP
jgi:dolichol-phosphate mannosyltransferase